ncbi:MAG: Asp-tRNA(Asn)/Glu-tRNA(Gln) amidotransferase subunit GatC [Bdellovibrio sp.]|nr:Asp-tRNA(Asn)/Glu-tRNA(Gln) amidotransferase subunit GatC [Bdellovibrio sp.]
MIDQKTIEQIAKLARLNLKPYEAEYYSEQLSKVLGHFQHISAIDTNGIEPLVTPSEIEFYARPDEVVKVNSAEEMVANAPERAGHLFKVPPVV